MIHSRVRILSINYLCNAWRTDRFNYRNGRILIFQRIHGLPRSPIESNGLLAHRKDSISITFDTFCLILLNLSIDCFVFEQRRSYNFGKNALNQILIPINIDQFVTSDIKIYQTYNYHEVRSDRSNSRSMSTMDLYEGDHHGLKGDSGRQWRRGSTHAY